MASTLCLTLLGCLLFIQNACGMTNDKSKQDEMCYSLCSCCLKTDTVCPYDGQCNGQCKDGYHGMKCFNKCPDNCVACIDVHNPNPNDTTLWSVSYCTSCKSGYYSTPEFYQCQFTCSVGCASCTSDRDCMSCNTGYFQSGSTCSKCPVDCALCTSSSQCNECKEGYYKSGGNLPCMACSTGCQNGACVKNSGECSCKTHYTGKKCDICDDGWYGTADECQKQCQSPCVNCLSESECTSCASGYIIQGTKCQNCMTGCLRCSSLNNCTQCQNRYYMSSNGVCSPCSNGCTLENQCNIETGSCSCKTGFVGEKCDQCAPNFLVPKCDKCVLGLYGTVCNQTCPINCKNSTCNKDTGVCTHGCNGSFTGDDCTICRNGWYGYKCTVECPENCLNQSCDRSTGYCKRCKSHFAGNKCDACMPGQYGEYCNLTCPAQCDNATCYRHSGYCDRCVEGYSGDRCCLNGSYCHNCSLESVCFKCVAGKFGETCDEPCPENCKGKLCNKVNGTCNQCIDGFQGQLCVFPLTGTEPPSGDSVTAAAGGAAGFVIVIVIVVVLAFFIKRRYRDQRRKTADNTDALITSDRVYANNASNTDTVTASNPYATITDMEPASFSATWRKEDTLPLHREEPKKEDRHDLPLKPDNGIKLPRSSKTAKASLKARVTSEKPDRVQIVQINNDNECFEEDSESDYYNSEAILEKGIAVGELAAYVDKKNIEFFNEEFKKLPKGLVKPANTASLDHNIRKNRYNEIYPYDESRVVLEGPGTDFINACYIDGYRKKRQYIASFGPIARATERYKTFWRMVWQEKTGKIVMVTNLMENGGMKCEQYWPDKNVTLAYGDVKVTCHSEDVYAEYTVRSFTVRKGKEQRPLLHIHFTAWPDKGVPDDVTSLVEFRNKVNSTKTKLQGPIIVHCSAGVGRTGTYIALDILTNQGKQKGFVDIFACVDKMRQQRTCMVQTADQYEYLHRALVHTLTLGSDAIPADRLIDYTVSLSDAIFGRLSQCTESVSIDEMEAIARNKELTAYNRQGADIPGDFNRPRLYYDRSPRDNKYINAIFVNSFRLKNQFILTQTPLPNTVDDFLTLVLQENCCCIVSMDASDLLEKSIGTYLPADNQVLHTDSFVVRCTMLESNRSYIQRALTIKYKVNSSSITVQHFLCANWSENARTPKSPQEFMTFVKQIQKVADELTQLSPIIVHCLTGSERSALLCVVLSLLQKIEIEHQVSVTNTVRQVKVRRPKAIPNKEQFKFCHQCVSAYLQSFDTYSNFS